KGKRFALPNAEVMIHQPLGGAQGQATEIEIAAKHILRTREKLNKILAERTGQPLDKIEKDTDRDNFMTAEEAAEYGLVDDVLEPEALDNKQRFHFRIEQNPLRGPALFLLYAHPCPDGAGTSAHPAQPRPPVNFPTIP